VQSFGILFSTRSVLVHHSSQPHVGSQPTTQNHVRCWRCSTRMPKPSRHRMRGYLSPRGLQSVGRPHPGVRPTDHNSQVSLAAPHSGLGCE